MGHGGDVTVSTYGQERTIRGHFSVSFDGGANSSAVTMVIESSCEVRLGVGCDTQLVHNVIQVVEELRYVSGGSLVRGFSDSWPVLAYVQLACRWTYTQALCRHGLFEGRRFYDMARFDERTTAVLGSLTLPMAQHWLQLPTSSTVAVGFGHAM